MNSFQKPVVLKRKENHFITHVFFLTLAENSLIVNVSWNVCMTINILLLKLILQTCQRKQYLNKAEHKE